METTLSPERADLLDSLTKHRALFLMTVQGMTEEQVRTRSTVSELTLGGMVKHLTAVERQWTDFIVSGPAERPEVDWSSVDWSDPPEFVKEFQEGFRLGEGETLAGARAAYEEVAARTYAMIAEVDLNAAHPLPTDPWFEPGARWSARRVFLNLIAETAQHAGHADIIREAIDGQKSMG